MIEILNGQFWRDAMSGSILRLLIFGVFFVHGIGQIMGILPVFRLFGADTENAPGWARNWSSRSWLLTDQLGESLSHVVCFVLYFASFILFISTALALQGWVFPHVIWPTLAIAAALVSLLAIVLFWKALLYLFPHKVGDIGVNAAVLIGLLVFQWPSESLLGY
jgi:hypothetical protein